jgi:hypothetical protein
MKSFLSIVIILFVKTIVFGENINKKDIEINGYISFNSEKNHSNLFNSNDYLTTIEIKPSINIYILKNLFFGPFLSYEYTIIRNNVGPSSWPDGDSYYEIIPGFKVGISKEIIQSFYPYFQVGFGYYSRNNNIYNNHSEAIEFLSDLGIKLLIGENLLIYSQMEYSYKKLNDEMKVNGLKVEVGFGCLLHTSKIKLNKRIKKETKCLTRINQTG